MKLSIQQIELSFITALIKKSSIDEIYFWFVHYVKRVEKMKINIDVFDLIWKVYYDFFALLSPKFELWLVKKDKKYRKYMDKDKDNEGLKILLSVIRNLFNSPINGDVFLLRQYCLHTLSNSDGSFSINKIPAKKNRKYYCKEKCFDQKSYVYDETDINNDLFFTFIKHMKNCSWKELCETLAIMVDKDILSLQRALCENDFLFYYKILSNYDKRITIEMARELWKKREGCSYKNNMHFFLALSLACQIPDEYVYLKKKPKIMLGDYDIEPILTIVNSSCSEDGEIQDCDYLPCLSNAFLCGEECINDENIFDWIRKCGLYTSWGDMILPVSKKYSKNNTKHSMQFIL